MSGVTALTTLPQPTKLSASRHWGTQGIRTRRSIWSPVGLSSMYYIATPPPPQVGETHLKSFLVADCIAVSQGHWCSGMWILTVLVNFRYSSLHFRFAMLELVLELILMLSKWMTKRHAWQQQWWAPSFYQFHTIWAFHSVPNGNSKFTWSLPDIS